MRETIHLACTECKRKNYTTEKSKDNTKDRLVLSKYCAWCGKHTDHKEEKS